MEINSKEYWDNRFKTDWKEYAGDKQTAFFAQLLCEQLPSDLVEEVIAQNYTVCDMGCAEGDSIQILSEKFKTNVDGMDFSEAAISIAREKNPNSFFWIDDLSELKNEKKYDVLVCSNVLEHFVEPWKIFSNLMQIANKYVVVMVPYKETLDIDEHEYNFSEENIPLFVNNFVLNYVSTVDGRAYKDSMYPDQQILMVFRKNDFDGCVLESVSKGIADAYVRTEREERLKEATELNEKIAELNEKIAELSEKNTELREKSQELNKRTIEQEAKYTELDMENKELNARFTRLEQEFNKKEKRLLECENAINRTKYECRRINNKISYKFFCVFTRFFQQFVAGSMEQKKNFLSICKSFLMRKPDTFSKNDGYNMVLNISNCLEIAETPVNMVNAVTTSEFTAGIVKPELPQITKDILKQEYTKQDVIFLSVIDYDFRFQRPQHFAKRFAVNGHRVFYVNANFIRTDAVYVKEDNLHVVDFANDVYNTIYVMDGKSTLEWMKEKFDNLIYNYAIRDAVVVVDYPNWVYGAEYIREKYGFKIVTDYMDDYTGFLGTTEDFLKNNCIYLLEKSDAVVVSSQFLADVAGKYTEPGKIEIVRNGTEVNHFIQAAQMEKKEKVRKVIGYYGAVSHWFAWEKVCYLAKRFTDCDIVIVGDVTDYKKQLEQYSNIELLGEKSYSELPSYLVDFDVCLIPFDTSTDLIKATNPVKFYEYLSAGKKVVATDIPELEPYRDKFVYMSNDDEKFAEYVRLCLEGEDSLEDEEACISFAKENDWQKRYEAFEKSCSECMPKVSIIVLTYNNLNYNIDCIDSILSKTAYANYELIIVDNQSTDGTVEYLKRLEEKKISNVKIVFNDNNDGFAGGNNHGIRESEGDYVLLLNNDTIVTRGWITSMVKHLEINKSLGMCNPVTNSIGNESMIKVDYVTKEAIDDFAYLYTAMHMNEEYKDVDRLPLFATLIRKNMINEIGLLDESYRIGMFEDDDYTESALRAGYKITITEDAFIHHINNGSFKKLDDAEYRRIFNDNKAIFEKKWNKKWTMPKYRDGINSDSNLKCYTC